MSVTMLPDTDFSEWSFLSESVDMISMYVVSKYINNLECNCQSSAFSVAGSLVGVQESRVFTRSHISARGMKL